MRNAPSSVIDGVRVLRKLGARAPLCLTFFMRGDPPCARAAASKHQRPPRASGDPFYLATGDEAEVFFAAAHRQRLPLMRKGPTSVARRALSSTWWLGWGFR